MNQDECVDTKKENSQVAKSRAGRIGIRFFRYYIFEYKRYHISLYAASTAFFAFLALIPFLGFLSSILPYTGISKEELVGFIKKIGLTSLGPFWENIIDEIYQKSKLVLAFSAVFAVWSGGRSLYYVGRGLNEIYGTWERRSFISGKIKTLVDTISLFWVFVATLWLGIFGESLLGKTAFLYGFFLLVLLFSVLYFFMPAKKMIWRKQLPGAFFSGTAWIGFSYGLSLYIEWFHGFRMYGSLAAITILLFWLYFSIWIFLNGALINHLVDALVEVK